MMDAPWQGRQLNMSARFSENMRQDICKYQSWEQQPQCRATRLLHVPHCFSREPNGTPDVDLHADAPGGIAVKKCSAKKDRGLFTQCRVTSSMAQGPTSRILSTTRSSSCSMGPPAGFTAALLTKMSMRLRPNCSNEA